MQRVLRTCRRPCGRPVSPSCLVRRSSSGRPGRTGNRDTLPWKPNGNGDSCADQGVRSYRSGVMVVSRERKSPRAKSYPEVGGDPGPFADSAGRTRQIGARVEPFQPSHLPDVLETAIGRSLVHNSAGSSDNKCWWHNIQNVELSGVRGDCPLDLPPKRDSVATKMNRMKDKLQLVSLCKYAGGDERLFTYMVLARCHVSPQT